MSISANSYLIVFASDKDKRPLSGELHINFKLARRGSYLVLFQGLVPQSSFTPEYPNARRYQQRHELRRLCGQAGFFAQHRGNIREVFFDLYETCS
jgi:hypothetical protein